MTIHFKIPGRAQSVANLREHWAQKAKRVANERAKAMQLCPKWDGGPLLVVTLWRHGTRRLDDDNLRPALKAYRDGIASRLGVDDGSELVRWEYGQTTCPSGQEHVEVAIYPYVDQEIGIVCGPLVMTHPIYTARLLPDEKPSTTPTPSFYKPRKP